MNSTNSDSGMLFSRKQFLWLLWALVLLRLLLNVVVPLMDPSEARYALICKLMTETGNFLEPKLIHDGVLMNFEGKDKMLRGILAGSALAPAAAPQTEVADDRD